MIDGLQHAIGHVLDEAGVENVTLSTLVKAWANVAQSTLSLDELKKAADKKDEPALIKLIEERWEHLDATRQNLANGNEEALEEISASALDLRVKTVASEGRLSQESIYALGKSVRAEKIRPAQWDEDLRLAVDQAMKIRGAEMRTNLIQENEEINVNDGRFNLTPDGPEERRPKVMHDFSSPSGWQLPSARDSITEMIARKDVESVMETIQRELEHYGGPGMGHRISAAMQDGLFNKDEFEQALVHGDADNLEVMLDRIERNDLRDLRRKRMETTTFEDLEAEFPTEIAGLNDIIRDQLEELVKMGGIDPEVVKERLKNGEIEELEDEVMLREKMRSEELERTAGRGRA